MAEHLMKKCVVQLLQGKTRILCTHRLEFVEQADTVVLMEDGTIVRTGRNILFQDVLRRRMWVLVVERWYFEMQEDIEEEQQHEDEFFLRVESQDDINLALNNELFFFLQCRDGDVHWAVKNIGHDKGLFLQ